MGGKRRMKIEDIREFIKKEGHELLTEEYINARQNLSIRCPKGHIYERNWNSFQQGKRCPYCSPMSKINKKKTISQINEIALKDGYEFLEKEWISAKYKMKCKCPRNHIFEINWNNFKGGKRCRYCRDEDKRLSYDYVKEYVEKEGYVLHTEVYVGSKQSLLFECPKGHIYEATFDAFKHHNRRCPHCKKSSGETKVREILEKFNVEYVQEYKIKECRNIYVLPFDFYLPTLNVLIEYDGQQHFKPVSFGNDDEKAIKEFKQRQINDNIKTQYCKDNNIELRIVKYSDKYNINDLI